MSCLLYHRNSLHLLYIYILHGISYCPDSVWWVCVCCCCHIDFYHNVDPLVRHGRFKTTVILLLRAFYEYISLVQYHSKIIKNRTEIIASNERKFAFNISVLFISNTREQVHDRLSVDATASVLFPWNIIKLWNANLIIFERLSQETFSISIQCHISQYILCNIHSTAAQKNHHQKSKQETCCYY